MKIEYYSTVYDLIKISVLGALTVFKAISGHEIVNNFTVSYHKEQ